MRLSERYKNIRKMSKLPFLDIVILIAVICSGCNGKEKDTHKIGAPFAINSSGDLLFCVVKRGSAFHSYIIPLKNRRSQPIALTFPGSDSCSGAAWISGAGHDELLFVTGRRPQTIKRLQVNDANVLEISSYMVDPNLSVTLLDRRCSKRDILAFWVMNWGEGALSGRYLGFSKDSGQTISISRITAPVYLLRLDHGSFCMAHDQEYGRMVISKVQLDVDNMTLQTHKILQGDEILLATENLKGSLVYVVGAKLFQDNEMLALLPEEVGMRPFVDGNYLACVSKDRTKIYILSDKGDVLDIKQKSRESMFVGLSATNRCIYLTTKDRDKILSYDFIKKREKVVFDSNIIR